MASVALSPVNSEFDLPKRPKDLGKTRIWLAVGALAVILLYFYPGAETFKSSSLVSRSVASATRPVEIEARLGKNFFKSGGEKSSLDISVLNRGNSALSELAFCVEAPGFEIDQAANCAWDRHERLEPVQRMTQKLTLTSLPHSGLSAVTVHVYWISQKGGAESGSVMMGPIRFDPMFGAFRWNRFGRRLSQGFKDLTLPLLLFLLTSQFSVRQSEKEVRDRAAETTRAEERNKLTRELERKSQEAQQAREEQNQVRQLLLERVMNLAQTYYMPIVTHSVLVIREGTKVQNDIAGASAELVLYHCLKLYQTFETLRKDKGGLFLKSLQAEYLISYGWILVKEELNHVLTIEQIELALNESAVLENYATFKRTKKRFAEALTRVQEWLHEDAGNGGMAGGAGFGSYVGGLDVIQAVLRHEINEPFWDQWYDDKKDSLGWDFQRSAREFPAVRNLSAAQEAAVSYLKANLDVYLASRKQKPAT